MNILLDEEAFDELTSGKVVDREGVRIALQDIGYARMIEILQGKLTALINK